MAVRGRTIRHNSTVLWAVIVAVSSRPGAVAEVDHAVAETALVQQLELQADIVGEELLAASDHDGCDEQLAFVDQPGPERVAGEVGTADRQLTFRRRLQLTDGLRVEVSLDPGPGRGRVLQRRGVHDLVGALPDLREVTHGLRLGSQSGVSLPADHRLVHAASVQVAADRPLEVVDEGVHLVVGHSPVEPAVVVLDVAIERCDRRVDQLGHGEPPSTSPRTYAVIVSLPGAWSTWAAPLRP